MLRFILPIKKDDNARQSLNHVRVGGRAAVKRTRADTVG